MRYNKLRKGVRSTPRKVRSRGIIYLIKRIITNFFIYVHASREMTAHLTRQTTSTLPMFAKTPAYLHLHLHLYFYLII